MLKSSYVCVLKDVFKRALHQQTGRLRCKHVSHQSSWMRSIKLPNFLRKPGKVKQFNDGQEIVGEIAKSWGVLPLRLANPAQCHSLKLHYSLDLVWTLHSAVMRSRVRVSPTAAYSTCFTCVMYCVVCTEAPSFARLMKDEIVMVGGTAVLQCMSSGSPLPMLTWLKDGVVLSATLRHFFTAEDQLLVIVQTVVADSGNYTCVMTNVLGSDRQVIPRSPLHT